MDSRVGSYLAKPTHPPSTAHCWSNFRQIHVRIWGSRFDFGFSLVFSHQFFIVWSVDLLSCVGVNLCVQGFIPIICRFLEEKPVKIPVSPSLHDRFLYC